ncbi:MAG: SPOR domain-containing protein [Flavobacteriales bacterium]|nr:SPOR domain-containing protein [Flavobacteriales bacterium]
MKKLIFVIILIFSIQLLFSQQTDNTDSLITIIKDSRIEKLNKTYKDSYKLKGYRIQIYSGNKKQPANQARSTFLKIYRKKKAHMKYEQPYYKVRVGDFKTKLEALKFKKDLTKHFPNCFIVKGAIDINEINCN